MAIRIMGDPMTLMIDNCVAVIWLSCRYVAESEEFAAEPPGTGPPHPGKWWGGWPTWSSMQDELATLSSDSVHMTAVKAGHNVHLDEPLLVVQAIRESNYREGFG
jgi:hypothetical protein